MSELSSGAIEEWTLSDWFFAAEEAEAADRARRSFEARDAHVELFVPPARWTFAEWFFVVARVERLTRQHAAERERRAREAARRASADAMLEHVFCPLVAAIPRREIRRAA